MKLISFVVPCYNSQAYMEHCVETLLTQQDRCEILIIDDGSKDNTGKIADRYMKQYPNTVKAIHQENGGHGEAINTGLANAEGIWFKVVDSDDWLDEDALEKVMNRLERFVMDQETYPDMVLANYMYDKVGVIHKKVISYTRYLPHDRLFTWQEAKTLPVGKYVLMHSVIYRTEILKECGIKLPAHTFYVDNLFVYEPLPFVKNLYYMDETLYHYYIGRSDQSVNEQVMIRRMDQQIRVNKLMVEKIAGRTDIEKHCYDYMYSYLSIITAVSSILLLVEGSKESVERKNALWSWIKEQDEKLYHRLRKGFLGIGVNLPGHVGQRISVSGYHIAQKLFGFN